VNDNEPQPERPKLAVAYDITATAPMDLAARLAARCEIVWVTDLSDEALGPMRRLLPRLGAVVDTAERSIADVADDVSRCAVQGVAAFCDPQLRVAARLAAELGLPGNSVDVVRHLDDKFAQRQRLAAGGVAGPRFAVVPPGDSAAVDAAIAAVPTPAVIKPVRGDSSRDVVAVADADAARQVLSGADGDMIIEEYLRDGVDVVATGMGSYVSVEAVVQFGEPIPLAVTGKFPLAEPFRESGNFMPHPLDADLAAEVLELGSAAARALGVENGALHVEVKLTPDGPRVIEVNGRVGGGAIDALFARRHGVSLTELAVDVALGRPLDVSAEVPVTSAGPFDYEFFAQPPLSARALRSIAGSDRIVGVAGAVEAAANRAPGDTLDWRNGSQGYVLRVSGRADDLAGVLAAPAAILAAANIQYD